MQGLEGNHLHTEKGHRQSTRLPLNKDGTEPKKKTKQIWQNLFQSFTNEEGDGNEKSVYSDELILRFLLILDPKWDPKQMSVFGLKNIDLDFSKEFLPTT